MTGEEKRIRRSHRWRRRITLGIAIVTGLLLTAAVFVAFWKVERRRAREEFLNLAHQRQDAAYHALMERLFVLQAVRSMYMASTFVERSEFATFTNLYINRVPGVEGLWWVPRIPASGRDECERLARRDGIEAFAVFEHDAKGRPIPASPREIYYPVLYAQPQREYRQFLGFDAGTLPSFRDVMRRARDENRTLVVQNESNSGLPPLSDAVVFVTPVYQKGAEILTVAERREHFLGLVMGGFRLSEILLGETTAYDTPPPPAAAQTVQVQLWDEPADAPFRPNGCDVDATKQNMWGFTFEPVWCSHRVYNVGGRRWVIRCTSVWHSVASTILPGGWGILSGGVALTALLTAYLYGLLYRAERVQNLVEKRTAELKTEIFARKQAEGSLLESLSFRDKLLEISLTGVFTVDSQRRITSVNRALLDMTGYTRDDLLGQSCSVLSCFGCGGHCNLFDTEQQHPIHNVECVIRSKEGRRIILRKNADWIRDRDGVVVGGVECLVDVTDLYKAKQDAETAVEAKREFLMRMSHEVRTPMNCVLGMTELALQTDLTEDQKRYLTLSRSSAETLSRMVGDILDYSNLEAGA
ncbi:MAG: CHASE domain-containing protein, partial [Phycisphaerae bacterium]|nr:CHASE domain-containing protein [Phycisphaerae bacterium]